MQRPGASASEAFPALRLGRYSRLGASLSGFTVAVFHNPSKPFVDRVLSHSAPVSELAIFSLDCGGFSFADPPPSASVTQSVRSESAHTQLTHAQPESTPSSPDFTVACTDARISIGPTIEILLATEVTGDSRSKRFISQCRPDTKTQLHLARRHPKKVLSVSLWP